MINKIHELYKLKFKFGDNVTSQILDVEFWFLLELMNTIYVFQKHLIVAFRRCNWCLKLQNQNEKEKKNNKWKYKQLTIRLNFLNECNFVKKKKQKKSSTWSTSVTLCLVHLWFILLLLILIWPARINLFLICSFCMEICIAAWPKMVASKSCYRPYDWRAENHIDFQIVIHSIIHFVRLTVIFI